MELFREPIGVIAVCIVCVLGGMKYHNEHSYTKAVERNFMAGCSNNAPQNEQGVATCACIYRGIKAKLSFSEFKAMDEQMSTTPPAWLVQLAAQCSAANGLS